MTCPDTPMAQAAAPTPIRIERRWPKEGHTRIPNWVYTDPDVFRKEMDVFFGGKTWNYVGLDCEVPEPTCYKRHWNGDHPVNMVRTETGNVEVLANRCANTGAPLCCQTHSNVTDFPSPQPQWHYNHHITP